MTQTKHQPKTQTENNMNNPSTVSRIWKDERHIRGSEHSQEVKNVKAFQSYHQNPKQAFRSRKNNGACKRLSKAEVQAFEAKLKNN